VLEAAEHETVLAEQAVVDLLDPDAWRALGFTVEQDLRTPAGHWKVGADRYVGVGRIGRSGPGKHVRVNPKIDADIFFLADYAFGSERDLLADAELRADLAALRDEPAACFLAWFLAETQAFIDRWLRRDYVLRREVFESRIRGRLLVGEYAGRFVASGQAHRTPCQFFDLTPDNLPNQILKAAIRQTGRLAARLPLPAARRVIGRRVARQLPMLAGVAERGIVPGDYRRIRLRGALTHYGPILEKSRAMLEGTFLSRDIGTSDRDAFMWDMSVLYEHALHGVIHAWPQGTLNSTRGFARIVNAGGQRVTSSKVKPDYVVDTAGARLVLDAKYKETRTSDPDDETTLLTIGTSKIRLSRSDIYQAVSYGQHDKNRPAVVGLVYPVALRAGELLPEPYRVEGFSQDVLVLFLDVGPHATANITQFHARLAAAAGLPSGL
jgi:5-methylcytosine-specific restriction enzyme subunit McrC